MPLLDHFHPPLDEDLTGEELHAAWGPLLALTLNRRWLPSAFIAKGHTHVGAEVEVDVATFERGKLPAGPLGNGGGVVTMPQVWAPPEPLLSMAAIFPDTFEVRVFSTERGKRLVAAVELVSRGNKDRADKRRMFVAKCASYLSQGVSLVIVDIVTDRHFNLHNELLRWMNSPTAALLPDEAHLYATAYRPVLRGEEPQIDVWVERCGVGSPLPTMPLRLTGDLFVPLELEATYMEICQGYRAI
jgi:hypothetical protein